MFITIRVLGSVTGHVVIGGIQNFLLLFFLLTANHGSLPGTVTKIFTFLEVWAFIVLTETGCGHFPFDLNHRAQ